ncbi:MAG: nodulation protein NfeD [bacterium]|jgi:membrane-bound serine protease (ClpP class)|nr:nodulation protein NfeD [bacterium]
MTGLHKFSIVLWVALLGLGLFIQLGADGGARGQADLGRKILILEIDGAIGPASSEYIGGGLERAAGENAALVILRMDTPGGLDTAMREIIQDILASPVPVATFVAPQGARAASAGTYILYASHVAAMAPGTNLGAATPINLHGPPTPLPGNPPETLTGEGDEPVEPPDKETPKDDAMSAKAVNDAAAYIESLARLHGRNAEWAVKAVREAAILPASKALEDNVIDLIADNVPDLIKKLEGREVEVDGRTITLELAGLVTEIVEPSWRTRILAIITNPNVALLLMMLGTYGLILEFYNPGSILPGTVGAISLLLALYALNVLPVSYAGLGLIGLGLVLIVAEAFAPSFGILGLGGGTAFVLGALLLFDTDSPDFQVSVPTIVAITVIGGGLMILLMTMAVRAQRRPVAAGEESVTGHGVTVVDWAGGKGTVIYHGEHWAATGPSSLQPGQNVTITSRDGLTLQVAETAEPRRT